MSALIKKLHIYLGLWNYSIVFVFGISGLLATLRPAPENRTRPESQIRYVSYSVPPGADDKQAAAEVYAQLGIPLTALPPRFALRRDRENNLTFDLYTVNGVHRVTVLEKEGRVRVAAERNNLWHFLNNLHTTTIRAPASDWRVRLWTWYNEAAIWSLIAMALSGMYLWLSSRPRFQPAQYAFLAGSGAFLLLYVLTR